MGSNSGHLFLLLGHGHAAVVAHLHEHAVVRPILLWVGLIMTKIHLILAVVDSLAAALVIQAVRGNAIAILGAGLLLVTFVLRVGLPRMVLGRTCRCRPICVPACWPSRAG